MLNDQPLFLLLLLCIGLLISLLSIASFIHAPILCTSFFVLFYITFLYLTTELHRWHDAQEFENRFWTLMAFVFSTSLAFVRDSPFANGSPVIGIFIVLFFTSGVQYYDRKVHRLAISRKPRMKNSASVR